MQPLLVDSYYFPPGSCFFCLTARQGVIIDTGMETAPPADRIYICGACMDELAGLGGYVPRDQALTQSNQIAVLLRDLDEAKAERAAAEEALTALMAVKFRDKEPV